MHSKPPTPRTPRALHASLLRLFKGRIEKGKIEKGRIEKGRIEKGRIEKGRIEKGKIEKRLKKEGLKVRRQGTGCFQNEAPRFEKKRRIGGVFRSKDA